MHIDTTPATITINPAELRYLRHEVAALRTSCQPVCNTIHAVVAAAKVALGWDLSQEATLLRRELAAAETPALTIAQ